MVDVIAAENVEHVINDDKGRRVSYSVRYNVATPELNPYRQQLQEALVARRGSNKTPITRPALAAAVSACDEFSRIENPTLANRQHFAMVLSGSKFSDEDAARISGITDYNDRMAALTARSKSAGLVSA